jgi:hypothetical protein
MPQRAPVCGLWLLADGRAAISSLCRWKCIRTSCAAHIEHDRRRCWQEAAEQFACSHALQPGPGIQAIALWVVPIVGSNLWVEFWRHDVTLPADGVLARARFRAGTQASGSACALLTLTFSAVDLAGGAVPFFTCSRRAVARSGGSPHRSEAA